MITRYEGNLVSDPETTIHGQAMECMGNTYICPEPYAMYVYEGALCIGSFFQVDPKSVKVYGTMEDAK